jgi:protein translocase SecG subunit
MLRPVSRFLLIVLVGAAVILAVWFLLTKLLFRFVPGLALPLLLLTAIILIVLVLIQRGKGGGLAGAFGGMGGQSAFGTKAGDLFTRVTIGVALFWIILCMATVNVLGIPKAKWRRGMGERSPIRQGTSSSDEDSSS